MLATELSSGSNEPAHLDRALRQALARHESALGRLRYELPSPSEGTLAELELAERLLRETQSRRDAVSTKAGRRG